MNKTNIIILCIVLLISFFIGTQYNKQELNVANQNLIAAFDSLNIIKDENDKLIYEKSVYISDKKQLESQIDISKKEINNLEDQLKSKISYISKLEGSLYIKDTIFINIEDTSKINDKVINKFSYNDEWLKFKGVVNVSNNILDDIKLFDINIPIPINVGLTKDNKMFIRSDNPYLNITDIKGAYIFENMINKKVKPKWSHGIHVGFGIQYGLIHKSLDMGPSLSYGITYNF